MRKFTAHMVKKYQFNQNELLDLFKQVKIQKNILATIQHPYEEKPWFTYQEHLITKQRTQDGLRYWKEHTKALQYAQHKYGVPASIIVAIIGVESNYGKINFKYRALDALATLSFYYPKRSKFFQQELEQYLLLIKEYNLDPLSIYGSYAGAIGPAQFMPSTYRHYAVSYTSPELGLSKETAQVAPSNLILDKAASRKQAQHIVICEHCEPAKPTQYKIKERRVYNNDDAIVSVANFLQQKGWQPHKIITVRAKTIGTKYQTLLINPPRLTIAQFKARGIMPPPIISNRAIALLIPLQKQQTTEYWLGFNNFMVLMKYNPNVNYAMAIYTLSRQLNNHQ